MSNETATEKPQTPGERLLDRLLIELFQTEQSAVDHPQIEAERLGDVPPAHAMRAVSEHATGALALLRAIAEREHFEAEKETLGRRIGDLFSSMRDLFADRLLDREKTYRATLIGVHHGVDLVTMLAPLARAQGRTELSARCEAWLRERPPLLERMTAQLAWFAEHPECALENARSAPREEKPAG